MNNPRWFWQAWFTGGGTITFYGDTKALALDHANTLARDFGKHGVASLKRIKHSKDVSATEGAAAGTLVQP